MTLGDGLDQCPGIGMASVGVENLLHRRRLDETAGVHHCHPLGQLRHESQVVGNENDRHAEGFVKVAQNVDDKPLVQTSRAVVARPARHRRLEQEGHGNRDALLHPSQTSGSRNYPAHAQGTT